MPDTNQQQDHIAALDDIFDRAMESSTLPFGERVNLRTENQAAMRGLIEQLEVEHGIAQVFRRLIAQHYSISGKTFYTEGKLTDLTEEEFDLLWDHLLPDLDDEPDAVLSNPASGSKA